MIHTPDNKPSAGTDPTAYVMSMLTGGNPSKVKSAFAWTVAAGGLALKVYSKAKAWQNNRAYSVSVIDTDEIYTDVQEWLLDRIPVDERRGLLASTKRGASNNTPSEVAYDDSSSRQRTRSVYLSYDGAKAQQVAIDGHNLTVMVEQRQIGNQDVSNWGTPGRITFSSTTRAGRDAAVRFLSEVSDAHESNKSGASLYVATKWGDWQRSRDIPPRSIESVVLTRDQREVIVDDLQRFMADEDIYTRLGIPWHRGYLLYGPPGTGKTSIAKALAGHLGLDLYYLPLSDMKGDTDLAGMFARVEPRSVLLLEDIDVVHAAKTRDDSGAGVSLSGLLNALDGVVTPHGLITIMTTNNIDVLDDALVRVGRADQRYHIDVLDDEQLVRLIESVVGIKVDPDRLPSVRGKDIAPAQIIEILKPHLRSDPSDAVALLAIELGELIDA